MTVSNVISPVLVYVDRLLIAAILTVSAVAHYATSWEIVTKYLLIPTALSTVLFPAFGYLGRGRSQRSNLYFGAGIKFTFLALFPLVLVTLVLARPGLALWIDPAFAAEAYRPMQVLAIGVLLNGMAAVPFAHIQGSGHPDVTAKLHLLELPVYLVLLWWALTTFGIVGAAAAWLVRVAVDFAVLYAVSHRMGRFSSEDRSDSRRFRAAVGFGVAVLVLIMLVENIALQAAVCAIVLVLGSFLVWRYLMRDIEKQFLSLGMNRILP